MFKLLYPYEYIDSVFSIDFEKLYNMGFRGVIFDIDNTLVHHGYDSNPKVDKLFREIQAMGFKTALLSNNSEERILCFIKNIDTMYIALGQKPKPNGYTKAVDMLGVDKNEVIHIGDQIFTDILGANRSGIKSILVEFLKKSDETHFGKRRAAEKIILNFYRKSRKYFNRIGDIKKIEGKI